MNGKIYILLWRHIDAQVSKRGSDTPTNSHDITEILLKRKWR